jgi:hypothetical protein
VVHCPISILAFADKNLAAEIHKVVGDYIRESIPITVEDGTIPSREAIESYHTQLSKHPSVVFAPGGRKISSSADTDLSIIPKTGANESLNPGQFTTKGPAASKEGLITIYLECSQLTVVTVHAIPTMRIGDLEAIFRQRRFINQGRHIDIIYNYNSFPNTTELRQIGVRDGDVFVVTIER